MFLFNFFESIKKILMLWNMLYLLTSILFMNLKISLILSLVLNISLISVFAIKIYNNWFEINVLKAPFRESIFAAAPIDTGKIFFVGDSDIEAFELNEFLDNADVRNRGIWGDVSSHVLNRMDNIFIQKPSKLFLKIGQNDICSGTDLNEIIANVEKIIVQSEAHIPNVKFFLISEIPCENLIIHSQENAMLKIKALNEKYKLLADKYNLTYIDVHSYLIQNGKLNKDYYNEDHAHLNGKGYLLFAKILKPYVNS